MTILKIGDVDFSHLINTYKVGYNVLLSDKSGRNAKGNTTIDIINRKTKIECGFIPMNSDELKSLLAAIEPYAVDVTYLDSKTNTEKTMKAYCSTAEPEYYRTIDGNILTKPMNINFIEL